MSTTYTPGPWIIRSKGLAIDDAYTIERLPDDGLRSVVAEIRDLWLCPEHGGSAEANARLIVEAPVMARLLQRYLDSVAHPAGAETLAVLRRINGYYDDGR